MTENYITIAEVKAFSKKGGAYVSCPANLVGQEVLIIPRRKIGEIKINVHLATTEFIAATRTKEAKKK